MDLSEFKQICSQYEGEFVSTEWNQIKFQNVNEITSYCASGEIHMRKKVLCEIGLDKRGGLSASEQTYAILGGCAGINGTEKELRQLLERYGFKRKEQMTLFELEVTE